MSYKTPINRRAFMGYFSGLGLSATLLPGVLWSQIALGDIKEITVEVLAEAEQLTGLEFTEEERKKMARGLNALRKNYETLREVPLDNSVPPAIQFNPVLPGMNFSSESQPNRWTDVPAPMVPGKLDGMAFWSVSKLAAAVKAQKVSSTDLTKMYLARLKKYGPVLECVVNLTEERALAQAEKADNEIASGNYRGPLHGIPWGAKDLLAVKGYKTTWGAMPYKDQVFDEDATVVKRLDEAGAVLIAKLTLGALAQGDVWYDGKTKCPWNPKRGSSGSSAGPGAATAGGLVGFSIGSETNGSIMSPSTVNGVTGLRPTYGRVSRHGAMALSWSMDKLGPMCRSVEDCALVLETIYGPDDRDMSIRDIPFHFDSEADVSKIRVGYFKSVFEEDERNKINNEKSLDVLRELEVDLIPVEKPDFPFNAMGFILTVEAAAAFDDLTRSGRDDLLVSQNGWPNTFRRSRMVPAVEYIQANRVRTKLMEAMQRIFEKVDVIVTPSLRNLYLGNFTGHPMIAIPNGFTDKGMPTTIGFLGNLYDEANLLAVAHACQTATNHHLKYPDMKALV
jgi:Asp-tRNA(Asn)/Glu-tRNA(Gln) amidotransferase A subunit family amidase